MVYLLLLCMGHNNDVCHVALYGELPFFDDTLGWFGYNNGIIVRGFPRRP